MLIARTLLLICLLPPLLSSGQAPSDESASHAPFLPVIDYNACPFEGCTFRKWVVDNSPSSLDCRVGRLIENAPHVTVALGGSVAVGHARALLLAGTGTDPRGEVLLRRIRRKGCCRSASVPNEFADRWAGNSALG